MNPVAAVLVDECARLSEDSKYTALSFTIWLRRLRLRRTLCLVFPVIFGALATAQIVTNYMPALAAVFTLLATTLPIAYRASRGDKAISQFTRLAGEFTILRDRFRQLGEVGIHKDVAVFEADFKALVSRIDKARKYAETPPEWCFLEARKKIGDRHMLHDYDEQQPKQNG